MTFNVEDVTKIIEMYNNSKNKSNLEQSESNLEPAKLGSEIKPNKPTKKKVCSEKQRQALENARKKMEENIIKRYLEKNENENKKPEIIKTTTTTTQNQTKPKKCKSFIE
jgi:hypothetical protein